MPTYMEHPSAANLGMPINMELPPATDLGWSTYMELPSAANLGMSINMERGKRGLFPYVAAVRVNRKRLFPNPYAV